jgi:flagellar biosynthesis protein FlhF
MMMETFTVQAPTPVECQAKIREKYGEKVVILNRKTVYLKGGFLGLFPKEGIEMTGYIPQSVTPGKTSWVSGDYPLRGVTPPTGETGPKPNWEDEKKKILAQAGNTGCSLKQVLEEVKALGDKLDERSAPAQEAHPSIARIGELLRENDFSENYQKGLAARLKKELTLQELEDFDSVQDKVLEWIGESIAIHQWEEKYPKKPRIMALVGATGVGKTSTVAKLAASLGIDRDTGEQIRNIALVTIDAYRISAKEQLETYGNILKFPTFLASEYDELKKIIALNSKNVDIILIDTIGRSPRDSTEIGAMRDVLEACGSKLETYLTLQATTKTRDLFEIIRRFEPFNCRSVIVTKLDETGQAGNVISVLADKSKSAAYITAGQTPVDIKKAEVIEFLTRLEGFTVNRRKLEERFGPGNRIQNTGRE